MKVSLGHNYEASDINAILEVAQSIMSDGLDSIRPMAPDIQIAGTLFQNAGYFEEQIVSTALAKLGTSAIDTTLPETNAYSESDILAHIEMVSSSLDLLLTSYADSNTFANGHKLTKRFSTSTRCPMLNVGDDIYAPQSALSELLGFQGELGSLAGKHIVVSWGYGTKFVRPSTAHSILEFGAKSGAHMKVVAPSEFGLLNRVVKDAKSYAGSANGSVEVTTERENAYAAADAVYALNWYRLDDFRRPERNAETASVLRDWYFKEDTLPSGCLFSSLPPLETDLLIDPAFTGSERNLSTSWFNRRIATLVSSIIHLLKE
ncbi:MAG: hypothetical protein ACTSUO_01990 [Candidatus Thorarchaeota archaeon]